MAVRKVTEETKERIVTMRKNGMSAREVAHELGLAETTISNVYRPHRTSTRYTGPDPRVLIDRHEFWMDIVELNKTMKSVRRTADRVSVPPLPAKHRADLLDIAVRNLSWLRDWMRDEAKNTSEITKTRRAYYG